VIVTSDAEVGRVLKLAAEIPSQEDVQSVAEVVSPESLASVEWEGVSLVLWQAPFTLRNLHGRTLPRTDSERQC
jgi:hypothetical protein